MSRTMEYVICLFVLAALAVWIYGVALLLRGRIRSGAEYVIAAFVAYAVIYAITFGMARHQRRTRFGVHIRPRSSRRSQ